MQTYGVSDQEAVRIKCKCIPPYFIATLLFFPPFLRNRCSIRDDENFSRKQRLVKMLRDRCGKFMKVFNAYRQTMDIYAILCF